MVKASSDDAKPGDLVAVFDKNGQRFGSALFNPRSQIVLRMLSFDDQEVDSGTFDGLLGAAVSLRRETLKLDAQTDAYRVVHAEGDGLSGLVVDRFHNVLSVEVFSYGMYRRLNLLLESLHKGCGTKKQALHVDPKVAELEGFVPALDAVSEPRSVRIRENGVHFAVDFLNSQKTGFFCDQRDNRERLAGLVGGHSVLDLCCYTGGFALYAKVLGEATAVTGVDLDEKAIHQARHNANLNQVRVRWVHADAFSYARQMAQNDRQWQTVVLDPPKFILSRDLYDEGRKKYRDLNRLALSLVAPGGLFVTSSCSGLLGREEFAKIVVDVAHRQHRRLQHLWSTGAGPDHPVMSNCPESSYLKVLWFRVV